MPIEVDGEKYVFNLSIKNLRKIYDEDKLKEEMSFEEFVERVRKISEALMDLDYLFKKYPELKHKLIKC